jgi:N-acyl-D-amino-acid deacylase
MKRSLQRAAMVLAIAIILGIAAHAQFPQGGYRPNTFTGGYAPQVAPNPFTGAGAAQPGVNPWTGAPTGPSPAVNPYTGRPTAAPTPTAYNSLTGKLQELHAVPTPTAPIVQQWPKGDYPTKGKAGPGLELLDQMVQTLMGRHGIPGAALAIAKDGKLVYAKGFGWSDLTAATPVDPLTAFGLASLSKPLTALAILWLIEHGLLRLDDCWVDILNDIQPLPGAKVDPRLKTITVRQLLNHSGGWDRKKSGDPANWEPQMSQAVGVPAPLRPEHFISFIMGLPLDFNPGADMEYSNVGYVILGRIIEKVSGESYDNFVRKHVLQPAGAQSVFMSRGNRPYHSDEARRYLAGTSVLLPPMDVPMLQGAGGWSASAVDMVRILTALDGSRGKSLLADATMKQMLAPPPAPLEAKADGTYPGLGWPIARLTDKGTFGYAHDGNYYGMRTFMKRSLRGVNFALLFNVSTQPDPTDTKIIAQAVQEARERVESIEQYPNIDLFAAYP